MRARIEEATARQTLTLNAAKFDRESFELINDMQLKWIDKRMEVETHIVTIRKSLLDNHRRTEIAKYHNREMIRLRQLRARFERHLDQLNRRVRRAERIFESGDIRSKHRASCWIAFSQLTLQSRLRFDLRSNHEFYVLKSTNNWKLEPIQQSRTKRLSMFQLANLCREKRLMVDTEDPEFAVIVQAFKEISDETIGKTQTIFDGMDRATQQLKEINESRRQGFGGS